MKCILFQCLKIQCKRQRLQRVKQVQGQYTSLLNYSLDPLLNFTASIIKALEFICVSFNWSAITELFWASLNSQKQCNNVLQVTDSCKVCTGCSPQKTAVSFVFMEWQELILCSYHWEFLKGNCWHFILPLPLHAWYMYHQGRSHQTEVVRLVVHA